MIKLAKPSTTVVMPDAMPTLNSEAAEQSSNKVIASVVTGDLPAREVKNVRGTREDLIKGLENDGALKRSAVLTVMVSR